jgi:hypothetical protein
MAISKLEPASALFVGQGDLVIFDEIDNYGTATIASLVDPKSLGQVVEDSTSWTGDDVTVDEIRDEQGNLITASVGAGTLAFECDLASTSQLMIQTFLRGEQLSASAMSSIFGTGTGSEITATGFGTELPVITRPIAWLNDETKRLIIFPKARITANLTNSDKLMRVHLNVLAESVDTDDLKTAIIVDATKAAE